MNFNFAHEFDIDVQGYWKIFLSDEFNEELYRDLKMKERTKVTQTDDGKTFHRVQRLTPSTQIPGFMASLIKGALSYTEIDTLDWATNSMKVVIEMDAMKDRFSMSGNYRVTPLEGGKRCKREFVGEIKVGVPLIGGKIEKTVLEQTRDGYDVAASATRRWIAKQKQA
jgi:hypothetical protein